MDTRDKSKGWQRQWSDVTSPDGHGFGTQGAAGMLKPLRIKMTLLLRPNRPARAARDGLLI